MACKGITFYKQNNSILTLATNHTPNVKRISKISVRVCSPSSKYQCFSPIFYSQIVEYMAPIRHTTTWNKTVYKIYLFVLFSIIDLLVRALGEFFIILVSCPVYTATPITHSVFRSELPLRRI